MIVTVAATLLLGASAGIFLLDFHTDAAQPSAAPGTPEAASQLSPSATPTPTMAERIDVAIANDATSRACEEYEGVLAEARTRADIQRRTATSVADRRTARTYVATHRWAQRKPYQANALSRGISSRFEADAASATNLESNVALDAYVDAFTDSCGLEELLKAAETSTARADAALAKLRRKAHNAPWWPVGWREVIDGVAWKPMSTAEYDCDFSSCMHVRVMARNGCDSLYFEVTELDSAGQVVGWANDMLTGLAPREVGIMIFWGEDDEAGEMRLSDVSCY